MLGEQENDHDGSVGRILNFLKDSYFQKVKKVAVSDYLWELRGINVLISHMKDRSAVL
jgi:hypothetical protein